MSGRAIMGGVLSACFLVFLYLASSTDLIIKEKENRVYSVSVILDSAEDGKYVNFKKGADQAARDLHVDARFITLYQDGDWEQQADLVHREISGDADAVAVIPVDAEKIRGIKEDCPLILFGFEKEGGQGKLDIWADYYRAGQMLAKKAAEKSPKDSRFYLTAGDWENEAAKQAVEGAVSVLRETGKEYGFLEMEEPEGGGTNAGISLPNDSRAVILAVDEESLKAAAAAQRKKREEGLGFLRGIYGIGSAVSVLNSLSAQNVNGIVAYDQYLAGYFCIQKAAEAAEKGKISGKTQLELSWITEECMWDEEYEKMLYPIE